MKKLKLIAIGILLVITTLSFETKNNFITEGLSLFGLQEENTVTVKEFKEFVDTELLSPIKVCYREAYPHAFMTKCYSDIKLVFDYEMTDESLISTIYEMYANVVYDNCNRQMHVCRIKVLYSEKKIEVQESFLSDWVSKDEYLKSFCEKVKTKNVEE